MKLGEALSSRSVTPEIYDCAGEAREHLREIAQELELREESCVWNGRNRNASAIAQSQIASEPINRQAGS